jgi:hypothetical protein
MACTITGCGWSQTLLSLWKVPEEPGGIHQHQIRRNPFAHGFSTEEMVYNLIVFPSIFSKTCWQNLWLK